MRAGLLRRALGVYLLLLVPIAWLGMRYAPYSLDGDAVAYMDLADLIHTHRWAGVVNGYWHPLYPALLAAAQVVLQPARMRELGAYLRVNYLIFLAEVAAMFAFTTALARLRERMHGASANPLLTPTALRLLGIGLVVIAAQRELGLDKIRPDALLQALMLAAFACLLQTLATGNLVYPVLMGLCFGLAYLTKSFAFLIGMVSILVLVLAARFLLGRSWPRALLAGALAAIVFAAIAGPYIAALSRQKHRLDFGDSGALNYAWFAGGTEKFHLEPNQPWRYGSATVHLLHPERKLLDSPPIYSYRAEAYGTSPDWFDPTYFNERITPHLNPRVLVHRDLRNLALLLRYLLNHPEAWVLLAMLLVVGARFGFGNWRTHGFWLPMLAIGAVMWALYTLVNIEERYVTLAYLVVLLPVFATLSAGAEEPIGYTRPHGLPERRVNAVSHFDRRRGTASTLVLLLAALALGDTLRTALDARRQASAAGQSDTWVSPQVFAAARGLSALGIQPGDEIACMETVACVYDPYYARLAGARITTEVYNSGTRHLFAELSGLPNREQVYHVVQEQGAKAIVAWFPPGTVVGSTAAAQSWVRLGPSDYYALPLNLPAPPAAPAQPQDRPWSAGSPGP